MSQQNKDPYSLSQRLGPVLLKPSVGRDYFLKTSEKLWTDNFGTYKKKKKKNKDTKIAARFLMIDFTGMK